VSTNKEQSSSSHPPPGEQVEVKSSVEEVKSNRKEGEEGESQEAASVDSEELSEGTCDMNPPMITLCTPESQLTPPADDTNDTSDQREQDTDTSKKVQEKITDGEDMDVDDQSETAHLESPPLTPPTAGHDLQPQALSISHDHSYCSQTPEDNSSIPSSGAPLARECKIGSVNVAVLDHTYCSQEMAVVGETADGAENKFKTGDTTVCDAQRAATGSTSEERSGDGGKNIGSKLSLTVHDHTYCSNSWPEPGEERRGEPSLVETSPEHHQEEENGAVALSLPKENNGESTAMDEGGVVVGDEVRSDVINREKEKGMEAELTHESAPALMELDTSGDSDVFTDGVEGEGGEGESICTSSSQSQELFSQQPSQEEKQIALALERREDASSTGAAAEELSSVLPTSREEGIDDQGANCDESADIAVVSEGESERDGNRGQSAATVTAEIKGQMQPTAGVGSRGNSGSADSSDSSSTHTYNAECSQRPSSLPSDSAHDHTPNQSKPEDGSSVSFLAALLQVREVCEKMDERLDGKHSLSQTELLACLQTLDALAKTTGKITRAVVHTTSSLQKGQGAAL
jgi:hypothetical protein